MEVCPECGEFVESLNDFTGWCNLCSGVTPPIRCQRCNKISDNPSHKYCYSCRYIRMLEKYADDIEVIMVTDRISARKAIRLVYSRRTKPICLCCGNPIKGGQEEQHVFCRTTEPCKRAHHSYRWHRTQNRSHEEAVNRALIAATIVKLTTAA